MILEIELPDGRTAEIEVPEGMSLEQAAQEVEQMYQTNPDAFGPAPQQPQEPGMLQQIEQAASKYFPPYGVVKGMFGEGQTGGGMENYGRGVASGLGSALRGVRQGWNKLTGDEEELAQLNQAEQAARQQLQQDTGGGFMSGAGRIVGQAAPMTVAAGLTPAVGGGVLASMGAGAAGGALGGATTSLTPEEEAGGNRTTNAVIGGVLGGAVPVVTRGATAFSNALRKVKPSEAVDDFAGRVLGAEPGKSSEAYRAVTEATEAAKAARMDTAGRMYSAVDEAAAGARVPLRNTADLGDSLDLPAALRDSLNPTTRRVAQGAASAADDAGEASFDELRAAIKEVRAAKRALTPKGPASSDRALIQAENLGRVENALLRDLDDWANASPENKRIADALREADQWYSREAAPFTDKNTPMGALLRSGGDEKAVQSLLRKDAGQAVEQMVEKVPGVDDPLRQLYGHQLRSAMAKGPGTGRAMASGGTTAEKLLSPEEAAYLRDVASRMEGEGGAFISPTLEGIIRRLGLEKANTMLGGAYKYGQGPVKQKGALSDFLRSMSLGQSIEDDD